MKANPGWLWPPFPTNLLFHRCATPPFCRASGTMSSSIAVLLLFLLAFVVVSALDRKPAAKIQTIARDFGLNRRDRYEFSFRVSFDDRDVAESFRAAVVCASVAPLVRASENGLRWVVEGNATTLATFEWYRSVIAAWTREMACRQGASSVIVVTASKPGSATGFLLSTDVGDDV